MPAKRIVSRTVPNGDILIPDDLPFSEFNSTARIVPSFSVTSGIELKGGVSMLHLQTPLIPKQEMFFFPFTKKRASFPGRADSVT